jgi:hypothetical protein
MPEVTITKSPGNGYAEWTIEQLNTDDQDDVAVFIGPNAEQRARAYADQLRTGLDLRQQALEEAAQACDALERSTGCPIWNDAVDRCAEAIRALIDKRGFG